MIIYEASKKEFLFQCDHDDIEEIVLDKYKQKKGSKVQDAEIKSWKNSLVYISKVLRDEEIPENITVAIELHILQGSKRIDVTLTGYDAIKNKKMILIELKQWEKVQLSEKDGIVKTFLRGKSDREVVHPSYQAWSYTTLLEGFNEAVYDKGITVIPCAYLHNFEHDGIINSPKYQEYIDKAPLFLKGSEELNKLRSFIKSHLKFGDDKKILHEIDQAKVLPSKALVDGLKGLLNSRPEFVLIDEQKVICEAILAAIRKASDKTNKVLIIKGGPGTGKTIVAIKSLVEALSYGANGKYVSKNAAPRRVYEAIIAGTHLQSKYSNIFTGSGSFTSSETNSFNFLIVDESHRLNEKSGIYGNLGENQIKELINASMCSIFFIDEDQRVTLKDIGSVETIESFAKAKNASIEKYELTSQFRCNGSDGYLAWLDNLLDIRSTANTILDTKEYDFKVFNTPEALHEAIIAKNSRNKARVVAGYCWPWASKKDPKADDIIIGKYRRQWNLDQDGSLWIMAQNSVQQVGCIHTCQGLEVEYIGVIIGDDLVVRNGKVITNPYARDNNDRSVRGHKKLAKEDPIYAKEITDIIIKNTYKTLMTRGMKGCYVFCSDRETEEYISNFINFN